MANHPTLNNVMIFNASFTLPLGTNPHDFQLVAYPDHVRFRVDSASRTLTYEPSTSPPTENDVTTAPSGNASPPTAAVIAVSAEVDLPLLFTRDKQTRANTLSKIHTRNRDPTLSLVLAQMGLLRPAQPLVCVATSSSERCLMSRLR
jgi:hypothetical protein